MNVQAWVLVGAVAAVGVLHTIAPDHWVPITLIARQRGWSMSDTAGPHSRQRFRHWQSASLSGSPARPSRLSSVTSLTRWPVSRWSHSVVGLRSPGCAKFAAEVTGMVIAMVTAMIFCTSMDTITRRELMTCTGRSSSRSRLVTARSNCRSSRMGCHRGFG